MKTVYPPLSLNPLLFRSEIVSSLSVISAKLPESSMVYIFSLNGALSHMEEFQAAFKCPAGSPMNADKKCDVY